jgi:hypothetical protein
MRQLTMMILQSLFLQMMGNFAKDRFFLPYHAFLLPDMWRCLLTQTLAYNHTPSGSLDLAYDFFFLLTSVPGAQQEDSSTTVIRLASTESLQNWSLSSLSLGRILFFFFLLLSFFFLLSSGSSTSRLQNYIIPRIL